MPAPIVFPVEPDAGAGTLTWLYGFLTNVLPSQSGPEQRVQLRSRPARGLQYPVLCPNEAELQAARANVYALQGVRVLVPLWHYVDFLAAATSIGATSFTVGDTTLVPWETAAYVILWSSPTQYEALALNTASGAVVTTTDAAGAAWPVGTKVIPALYGRLSGSTDLSARDVDTLAGQVAFDLEPSAGPGWSPPAATVYAGFDVLELTAGPGGARPDPLDRPLRTFDPGTGFADVSARFASPAGAPKLTWLAFSRSEARDLQLWFDARIGRAKPFWVPAWTHDLTLSQQASSGTGSIRVYRRGYGALVFPMGRYRRHLALRPPGGAIQYRKVTGVTDNGDGTETLTLASPALSATLPVGSSCSQLRLCRLDQDVLRLEYSNAQLARAEFALRELPEEVPA